MDSSLPADFRPVQLWPGSAWSGSDRIGSARLDVSLSKSDRKEEGRRRTEAEEGGRRDVQEETECLLMNKVNVAHGDNLHAGKNEASAL